MRHPWPVANAHAHVRVRVRATRGPAARVPHTTTNHQAKKQKHKAAAVYMHVRVCVRASSLHCIYVDVRVCVYV